MTAKDVEALKQRVIDGGSITFEEAKALVALEDKELLYAAADGIRQHFTGKSFDTCSITNAKSGACPQNCSWCSQSGHHKTKVEVYDLISYQEAQKEASYNAAYGIDRYSLVTSGRALSRTNMKRVCDIYRKIGAKTPISLCASHGLITKEDLQDLKRAGVSTYHCNLETSRTFFATVCTTHTYDEKLATINAANEVGMKLCSGGIIGLGESMDDRIQLAFELKKVNAFSIPLNLLQPMEGTPLQVNELPSEEEILTTFSIFRFINPSARIRFAAGRMQIKHIQEKALKTGINGALVGDLLTTIGSNIKEDLENFKAAGFELNPVPEKFAQ